MSRRPSPTDVLLILVAVALICVWFIVPGGSGSDSLDLADWSDLPAAPKTKLVVQRGVEKSAFVVARDSGDARRFQIEGRPNEVADPAALDRLLTALGHLEVLRVVREPRAKLGLDHPTSSVEIVGPTETRRIALGRNAPSPPGARYAEITRGKRNTLVVLASDSAQAIDVDPDTLLEHRVLDWLPSELRRVELTHGLGTIILERAGGGQWLIATSEKLRARRRTVEQFLLALTELSTSRSLDAATAAAMRKGSPLRRILLRASRDEQEESLELVLGGACPSADHAVVITAAGKRNVAGCVDETAAAKLTLDADRLVDDAAFSIRTDEVDRMELKGPNEHWFLARKDVAFQLTTDVETPVTLEAGNGLLDALTAVSGTSDGSCRIGPLSSGTILSLRSFVVGDGDASFETIQVGPRASDGRRRVCRDDGAALLVGGDAATLLDIEPGLLRDPRLLDVAVEALGEVRLETPAGRQLLRRDAQGVLVLIEPERQPADPAAIESLREQLAHLRAARWLTRSAAARAGESRPNARVEFTVDDATRPPNSSPGRRHVLRLLVTDTELPVAWFDEEPTAFRLEPALGELLDGLLLDRSLLRLTNADRTVTLSRGPNQIRLRRTGDQGVTIDEDPLPRGSSTEPARYPKAGPIALTALENLDAVAVYGPASPKLGPNEPAALHIEYAGEHARVRLHFRVGSSFVRHGKRVHVASLDRSRLRFLLTEESLRPIFALVAPGSVRVRQSD